MKHFSWLLAVLFLSACGKKEDAGHVAENPPPPAGDSPSVATATAETASTANVQLTATQGNTANGGLTLTAMPGGVKISGVVQGLKPDSQFGFHFHEKGDCSAPDATSAGAHFNPGQQQHGNPQAQPHHAGDMLNVKSDAQGVAEVSIDNADVTLHTGQPTDVLDKAIVMHAKPDDYQTQPSGDSGDRIACGVVAVATAPN